MTVRFNYKKEHILQVPFLLEKAFASLPDVEMITEGEADLAINSMPWQGIVRGKKTVYWELDIAEAHHSEDYEQFDIVYFPSNMKKKLWAPNGRFLPMAVDPEFFHPMKVPITKDVVFMGRLDRSLRGEYTNRLKKVFDMEVGQRERGIPTSTALSAGKCSFQISEFQNLEQRNFEYSAVLPMVLERVPDIELFEEDKHYKGFDRENYQEFEDQIRWCVENQEEAMVMRDRMIAHLKTRHTYADRAREIISNAI